MNQKRAIHFALILSYCLALIACDKVPMPTSDSTPPRLSWTVLKLGNKESTNVPSGGTYPARKTDSLLVTLTANDPQGVSYIEMGGGYVKYCTVSGGQTNAQGILDTLSHSITPDADNQVLTETIETRTVQAVINCNSGDWSSTVVALNGLARNYFSGETNATLTINFKP
jgi:hypothetical protein